MLAFINHLEREVKIPLSINRAELYLAACNALMALNSQCRLDVHQGCGAQSRSLTYIINGICHLHKLIRTDVWAVSEAKVQQGVLPMQVHVCEGLVILVHKLKWSPNCCHTHRCLLGPDLCSTSISFHAIPRPQCRAGPHSVATAAPVLCCPWSDGGAIVLIDVGQCGWLYYVDMATSFFERKQ